MSNFNYGKHTMSMATTSSAGGQAAAISLPIEGMTCASCVGRVEAALAKGPRRGPKPADGEAEDEDVVVEEEAA